VKSANVTFDARLGSSQIGVWGNMTLSLFVRGELPTHPLTHLPTPTFPPTHLGGKVGRWVGGTDLLTYLLDISDISVIPDNNRDSASLGLLSCLNTIF